MNINWRMVGLAGVLAALFVVDAVLMRSGQLKHIDHALLRALRHPDARHTLLGPAWGLKLAIGLTTLGAGSVRALAARSGEGLDALREALLERAGATHVPDGVFIARTRHVEALARTRTHLELAQGHADQRDAALDLFAEELRLAHDALGEITGQFTADDLLGEIFGRFCIGK